MDNLRKIAVSIVMAVGIFMIGTMGYFFIEGWNIFDAAYMTAITLSTVGYGETHEISNAGRVFTMVLIFAGAGYFLYLASLLVQTVVEGELITILGRRKLDKAIKKLDNHYIICGYGRIGRTLCSLIREETSKIIVIEQEEALVPVLEKDNIFYLHGDASDESLIQKAGIVKAKVFIAALATDAANVFLVLTARQLNPGIFIMATRTRQDVTSYLCKPQRSGKKLPGCRI